MKPHYLKGIFLENLFVTYTVINKALVWKLNTGQEHFLTSIKGTIIIY